MDWSPLQIALIGAIGLSGGLLGGLVGLGGSMVILPALTLAMGTNQHLYQSAALVTNVLVAIAAVLRHRGRGTIRRQIAWPLGVAGCSTAIVGVLVSNLVPPVPLAALFGAFLAYASIAILWATVREAEQTATPPQAPRNRSGAIFVGGCGGFASGLLGIGGGAVMVPMLQRLSGLNVREAVATSSMAMIPMASIGAVAKFLSVPVLAAPDGSALERVDVLALAALLGPPAMLGASLGAAMVYRLPVRVIRATLGVLLLVASFRMLGLVF
jgi:uncharacterized membrane protein YfcA